MKLLLAQVLITWFPFPIFLFNSCPVSSLTSSWPKFDGRRKIPKPPEHFHFVVLFEFRRRSFPNFSFIIASIFLATIPSVWSKMASISSAEVAPCLWSLRSLFCWCRCFFCEYSADPILNYVFVSCLEFTKGLSFFIKSASFCISRFCFFTCRARSSQFVQVFAIFLWLFWSCPFSKSENGWYEQCFSRFLSHDSKIKFSLFWDLLFSKLVKMAGFFF